MSRLAVLLRNEWLKASRMRAFQVVLLLFVLLHALVFWVRHTRSVQNPARSSFALPEAWPRIFTDSGPVPGYFLVAVVVLLVANEFPWRTARQNVIDGLSREQFFTAKALLVPAAAVVLVALLATVGGGMALLGPDPGRGAPLVRLADLRSMAGAGLTLTGFGTLAFFAAMALRSPGSAIGAALLYLIAVEQVVGPALARLLASDGDLRLAYVLRWLPGSVFQSLPPAQLSMMEVVIAMSGGSARPGTAVMVLAALSWMAAFTGGGYLLLRRRDL